jgi:hypothetical protein
MKCLIVVTGLLACGPWPAAARAAWAGFEQPSESLCLFGSPLRERQAEVVITGRFEAAPGRARPVYTLVFTANDGIPEVATLGVSVDKQDVAHFDVSAHVPAASGASAVVALNTETLGVLLRATDSGKTLRVVVPSDGGPGQSYDFGLGGFATAADVFTACMLRNKP